MLRFLAAALVCCFASALAYAQDNAPALFGFTYRAMRHETFGLEFISGTNGDHVSYDCQQAAIGALRSQGLQYAEHVPKEHITIEIIVYAPAFRDSDDNLRMMPAITAYMSAVTVINKKEYLVYSNAHASAASRVGLDTADVCKAVVISLTNAYKDWN